MSGRISATKQVTIEGRTFTLAYNFAAMDLIEGLGVDMSTDLAKITGLSKMFYGLAAANHPKFSVEEAFDLLHGTDQAEILSAISELLQKAHSGSVGKPQAAKAAAPRKTARKPRTRK